MSPTADRLARVLIAEGFTAAKVARFNTFEIAPFAAKANAGYVSGALIEATVEAMRCKEELLLQEVGPVLGETESLEPLLRRSIMVAQARKESK